MVGSILKFSIEQRWIMMGLTLIMAGIGAYNAARLNIDAVPDITNVQVQISARAAGLSALEIEQRITFPIETGMAGLPRLVRTRSLSQYGIALITVIFEEGTDIYFARRLVSERIQEVKGKLPAEIEPVMGPISTGLGEIFLWTVETVPNAQKPDGMPYTLTDLRTIQDWIIRPQLRNTPGVTEINTIGGYEKQFHIAPDPYKLISYGLTFGDVISSVSANNVNVGAGYIERSSGQYLVRVPGQVTDLDDIRNITLKTVRGTPVFIKDVAVVELGKELRLGAATKDGEETVLGTVFMLMGENSREIAHRADLKLQEINRTLPPGVTTGAVYDRTTLVDKTIATVTKSLTEGALVVVIILLIFLGNIRAAFITALVIPLSMLFAATGMVWSKLSANLMSLGAIDFGIIVDGAVVIVENCSRRLAESRRTLGRALNQSERIHVIWEASQEVRKPMIFGELIIIIVYLPILTLTGVEGKMFIPMALTVLLALTGALLLSFTFVPSAVAVLLSGQISHDETFIARKAVQLYRPLLQFALKYRILVVVAALVVVSTSVVAATMMGREFIPTLDEGDIAIHTVRVPETSLTQAIEMQTILEKTLKSKFPQIETIVGRVGTSEVATEPHPPSIGDNTLVMKPRHQWPDPTLSKADLVKEMEMEAGKLLGSNFEFSQPIRMRFNHLLSGVLSDVAIKVFGDEMDTLLLHSEKIADMIRGISGATHVKVEQVSGLPILTVKLNRHEMARFGLHVGDVQDTVEIAVGGKSAGQVFEGDRRFDIVVRLPEQVRTNVEFLKRLPIPLPQQETGLVGTEGALLSTSERRTRAFVTLGSVADLEIITGPNQISREDGKRRVVVTCNVRDRDLGSFVAEAQEVVRNRIQLPPGYWVAWGGEFEQLLSAAKRLRIVVPVTMLLILGLLLAALKFFKDALLVFTGVPLALTGGIIALYITDIPLSISAAV